MAIFRALKLLELHQFWQICFLKFFESVMKRDKPGEFEAGRFDVNM